MPEQLKGALIGCGYIAPFHMGAWQRTPNAEIVAVCDMNEEAAHNLATQFDVAKVYSSPEAMFQNESLDFVDIATRPASHEALVGLAAKHAVAVLCQKPFSATIEEAERMARAGEEADIVLMVNENTRWLEPFRRVKTMLDDGSLGTPHYARFHLHADFARPLPTGEKPPHLTASGQPYLAGMERAVFYESAMHCVDVARFLFGEAKSIYAKLGTMSPFIKGDDQSLAVLDVGGVHVLIDMTWSSPVDPQIHADPLFLIETSRGAAAAWMAPSVQLEIGKFLVALNGEPACELAGSDEDGVYLPFARASRHFIECLQSGAKPETDARDNIKTLKATFAAYDSNASGKEIRLN